MSGKAIEMAGPTTPKPNVSIPRSHNAKYNHKGARQRPNGTWCAEIRVQQNKIRRRLWLGTFTSEEAAAAAYNGAYLRYRTPYNKKSKPRSRRGSAASSGDNDGVRARAAEPVRKRLDFTPVDDLDWDSLQTTPDAELVFSFAAESRSEEVSFALPDMEMEPLCLPPVHDQAVAWLSYPPAVGFEMEMEALWSPPVDDIRWDCLQPDTELDFSFAADYNQCPIPYALPEMEMEPFVLPPVHDLALSWLSYPPAMGVWEQLEHIWD